MNKKITIGFLGIGNMGSAIAGSLINNKIIPAKNIFINDLDTDKIKSFKDNYPESNIAIDTKDFIEKCEIIFLCVKPQTMEKTCLSIGKSDSLSKKIIISIAAGITIEKLQFFLKKDKLKLIRVMPNTPALIGLGAGAVTFTKEISESEKKMIKEILSSTGVILEVTENMMDAVTAISGSGPAFLFEYLIQMENAGVKAGLSREISLELAKETIFGAISLLKSSKESTESLRNRVTSPGGTTEAGLKSLKEDNFSKIIENCINKAKLRSIELS